MTGKLKILATPIGNVQDISLRAINELKNASFILAEDTRHTAGLLNALSILLKPQTKFLSCHSYNEKERLDLIIEKLSSNEDVLLVSDAGCPTISDPGGFLVKNVVEKGFLIEVIPGPSSITASLMGSSLEHARFAFLGFLPKTKSLRKKMLSFFKNSNLMLIIFESPLRVNELLKDLFEHLGQRKIEIARELTKLHETFHRGILSQNIELFPPFIEKGECVVLVEGDFSKKNNIEDNLESINNDILKLKQENLSNKDIIKFLIEKFAISKNEAYDLVLKFG